jgi:hypothetical protein
MTGRVQPSWTSPLLQSATFCVRLREPSSLGIHPWYAPLYRLSRVCPLPGSKLPFGDERATVRRSVPPSWFCTTSTVFPTLGLAGLLHPATDSGVRCVSAAPRPRGCRSDPVAVGGLPRNAFHTPRRIPPVSSRTASLRPLPSCCYLPIHTAFHTEVLVAAGRGTLLKKTSHVDTEVSTRVNRVAHRPGEPGRCLVSNPPPKRLARERLGASSEFAVESLSDR